MDVVETEERRGDGANNYKGNSFPINGDRHSYIDPSVTFCQNKPPTNGMPQGTFLIDFNMSRRLGDLIHHR
jgi:hypothetical protein